MRARGQDVKITVMQDGRELVSFRTQNSVGIDFGMSTDIRNPVGGTRPEIFGQNDEVVVTLEPEPDRPEFLGLFDAQRKANLPNADRTDFKLDMTCSVDFGGEGRARIALAGGTLRAAKVSDGGRLERVKTPFEIVYPDWRRI